MRVEPDGENLRIRVDGEEFNVGCTEHGLGEFCLFLNGRPQVVNVQPEGEGRYRVMLGGGETTVSIADPVAARVAGVGPRDPARPEDRGAGADARSRGRRAGEGR